MQRPPASCQALGLRITRSTTLRCLLTFLLSLLAKVPLRAIASRSMGKPAILLFLLLALGSVAGVVLSRRGGAPAATVPPVVEVPTPSAPAQEPTLLTSLFPPGQPTAAAGQDSRALMDQITRLEGQVEYLQGQVRALQDENAELINRLGMLGAKGQRPGLPGEDTIPDFVGLGLDMMKLRGLQALPMTTVPLPLVEVEKKILAWLRQEWPGDEPERFGRALHALGWIPERVDPLTLRAALMARQIGGWYDATAETLFTVDASTSPPGTIPPNTEALAIALGQLMREYGPSLLPPDSEKSRLSLDARLAREALIGGDAALTRFLNDLQRGVGPPTDEIPIDDPDHPLNQVPMPHFLRQLALFPFNQGFEFAQSLHAAGQFTQVNACYRRPPGSTLEVIDTGLYLGDQRALLLPVTLSTTDVAGKQAYWDDTLGWFATVTALRMFNEDAAAAEGARGWRGDRLLAWPSAGKRDHAAWQTVWVDDARASAFFKAMTAVLTQRYELEDAKPSATGELELAPPGRTIRLTRNRDGRGVLLIDAGSMEFALEATNVLNSAQ